MAPYALVDEVRAAVTRDLNKVSGSSASMTDDQIEAAIDNAQSQVDSKMRRLYLVPFSPAPAMIKSITIDIAGFLATANYRQEKIIPETDPIVRRYNRAHDLLCHLAQGFYALEDGDGLPLPRLNGLGRSVSPSAAKLFTADDFGVNRTLGGALWLD